MGPAYGSCFVLGAPALSLVDALFCRWQCTPELFEPPPACLVLLPLVRHTARGRNVQETNRGCRFPQSAEGRMTFSILCLCDESPSFQSRTCRAVLPWTLAPLLAPFYIPTRCRTRLRCFPTVHGGYPFIPFLPLPHYHLDTDSLAASRGRGLESKVGMDMGPMWQP
jgi:hypothetical protein